MKLLTKRNLEDLPPLYTQEKKPNPIAQVKFFAPWSNWTWYAIEFDPKLGLFFGYVVGLEYELGYFSLKELESVIGPLGMKIERDRYFKPTPLNDIKSRLAR